MSVPTPIDELGAVNVLLQTIGETPVSTLSGGSVADVAIARSILHDTSEAVQAVGWHFNTERNYPLVPGTSGLITLPPAILRVDQDQADGGDFDLVQRGTQLYDRKHRTPIFTRVVKAEVVLLLAFSDLPPVVRRYIAVKAARIFQARMVGSESLNAFTERDEYEARAACEEAEGENADHTIFDNYTVYRSLDRR